VEFSEYLQWDGVAPFFAPPCISLIKTPTRRGGYHSRYQTTLYCWIAVDNDNDNNESIVSLLSLAISASKSSRGTVYLSSANCNYARQPQSILSVTADNSGSGNRALMTRHCASDAVPCNGFITVCGQKLTHAMTIDNRIHNNLVIRASIKIKYCHRKWNRVATCNDVISANQSQSATISQQPITSLSSVCGTVMKFLEFVSFYFVKIFI